MVEFGGDGDGSVRRVNRESAATVKDELRINGVIGPVAAKVEGCDASKEEDGDLREERELQGIAKLANAFHRAD